jgi:hypothetical protein
VSLRPSAYTKRYRAPARFRAAGISPASSNAMNRRIYVSAAGVRSSA